MKIKNLLLLTIIVIFTGCINITKEIPAYSTYTLHTNINNSINTQKALNIKLEIKEPKALSSVNSKFISYSTKSFKSETYALSKWSDRPSKMIQSQIIKYLSKTNHYNYINSANIHVKSDYDLLSEIDSFQQYFIEDKSFVEFSIRVYLKNKTNTFYKSFQYTQKCEENNALGAVKSFNTITNKFVKDLDNWIVQSLI